VIDFRRVTLSLPAVPPPLALLPPLPRAQLAFWPPLALTLEPRPKPARTRLARFREWLGCDPREMDQDDVLAAALEYRRLCRRRRPEDERQPELPARARNARGRAQAITRPILRVAKPRSLGYVPTGAERKTWKERVKLPVMPATRGDCPPVRPCPFVRCRYHLKLHVDEDNVQRLPLGTSALLKDLFPRYEMRPGRDGVMRERYIYPGMPLEQMPFTCALDVADGGPRALDAVGAALSVVLERARQFEVDAIEELRAKLNAQLEEAGDVRITTSDLKRLLRRMGDEWAEERRGV